MSRSPLRWDNHKYWTTAANGAQAMKKRTWIRLAAIVAVLGAAVVLGYREWSVQNGTAREEALALMPPDAIAILFADFDELRPAPFVARLYAWAPKPQVDAGFFPFRLTEPQRKFLLRF